MEEQPIKNKGGRPPGKVKHKGGRPTVITDIVVAKLEEAMQMDCTVSEACLNAGISRDAYYDLLKKKPELSDRFEVLRNTPILNARRTITKSIKTNPGDAFNYLSKKARAEFGNNLGDGLVFVPTQIIVNGTPNNQNQISVPILTGQDEIRDISSETT